MKYPKCPKCESEWRGAKGDWECGSSLLAIDDSFVQSNECRILELTKRVDLYKELHSHALDCVDEVFQTYHGHEPLLPDFLVIGEDKFDGVIKLAKAYLELKKKHSQ